MADQGTDLTISVQEGSSWSKTLSITVPVERVQRTRGRVADQITRGARLPGFRKGRLPAGVVEKKFGPSIDQETIDRLIQEAYKEALEAQGITPISQGRVGEVNYDRGAPLKFEVEVEVKPEIELPRLKGFTASRPDSSVGDTEVDAVLDRLRNERADWEPLDAGKRPEYGDQVLVEITALPDEGEAAEDPRTYRIVLGEGQAIPDVEAAILTLAEGESAEFTVSFPDDFPDEARRSQQQRLLIAVMETRKKVLPELDDAFAKSVGDFEGVAALRERVLNDLKEDASQRSEGDVRRQLIDQVLEANPFEAPRSMLDRYLDYMLDGPPTQSGRHSHSHGRGHSHSHDHAHSPEEEARRAEMRQRLQPQAEWGLKRTLVVDRIAELEGLTATQDEIDERVEKVAAANGRSASEVWIQLEKSGQLADLERDITEEKVFEFLKSQNTVV